MGNSAPHATSSSFQNDTRIYLQTELSKFVYINQIGFSKFLKTYRCKVDGVQCIIKIYLLRNGDQDLSVQVKMISQISKLLPPDKYPCILPYQRWLQSERQYSKQQGIPCFLIRQYIQSNLYDRLSTRPFLTRIEKLWIIYQLMRATKSCHEKKICHGDIKSENILVTSWNWIMLTDFGSYKPTFLPEDDPSDFNYFFNSTSTDDPSTVGRSQCYISPERFFHISPHESSRELDIVRKLNMNGNNDDDEEEEDDDDDDDDDDTNNGDIKKKTESSEPYRATRWTRSNSLKKKYSPLKPSMDVFSIGCIIAEIYLDGEELIDLPGLLSYRAGSQDSHEHEAFSKVRRIRDGTAKDLIYHMLQKDPKKRKSLGFYIERLEKNDIFFPKSFRNFMYDFMAGIQVKTTTPDSRLAIICKFYKKIIWEVAQCRDEEGEIFFDYCVNVCFKGLAFTSDIFLNDEDFVSSIDKNNNSNNNKGTTQSEGCSSSSRNQNPDISPDFPDLNSLSVEELIRQSEELMKTIIDKKEKESVDNDSNNVSDEAKLSNGHKEIKESNNNNNINKADGEEEEEEEEDGKENIDHLRSDLIIIVQLVCSCIRHLRFPFCKLIAIHLLLRLGLFCDYETILQRIIPYLIEMLDDTVPQVRAMAVRSVTTLLHMVQEVPRSDYFICPQYIFPALKNIEMDKNDIVRIAFAECISILAETSKRFLDLTHAALTVDFTSSLSCEKQGSNLTSQRFLYENELQLLYDKVTRWIQFIVNSDASDGIGGSINSSSLAKRALLKDIVPLCIFFGQEKTLDWLIPQIFTFLNDRKDWELRYAIWKYLPGVCAFLGKWATAHLILPFIDGALQDTENIVIAQVLKCIGALVELGLLNQNSMVEKATHASPLLFHPSNLIRNEVILLMEILAIHLGPIDTHVFLFPILKPYLRYNILELNFQTLTDALQDPLQFDLFDKAIFQSRNNTSSPIREMKMKMDESVILIEDNNKGETKSKNVWIDEVKDDKEEDNTTSTINRKIPNEEKLKIIQPYIENAYKQAIAKMEIEEKENESNLKTRNRLGKTFSGRTNFEVPTVHLKSLSLNKPQSIAIPNQKHYESNEKFFISLDRNPALSNKSDIKVISKKYGLQLTEGIGNIDPRVLVKVVNALNIPPLPPKMGCLRHMDGRAYSLYDSKDRDQGQRDNRKPKQSQLLATLTEHTAQVNRAAVSQDNNFLVTCSNDGTSKVWELKNIDQNIKHRAALTYERQGGRILDMALCDNSHAVATASSKGTINVWRPDIISNKEDSQLGSGNHKRRSTRGIIDPNYYRNGGLKIQGSSLIKCIKEDEGCIVSVSHYLTDSSSLLLYATQKGLIHCWDLRMELEPWQMKVPPELGFVTAKASGPDRNWICAGTNRGYLILWDVRFQILIKVWRHSSRAPITRLATCAWLPEQGVDNTTAAATSRPILFVAAGTNEAAVWDLSTGGECKKCFRTVLCNSSSQVASRAPLPYIEEVKVPSHFKAPILTAYEERQSAIEEIKHQSPIDSSVRALVGRVSISNHSYLITGSSDCKIRFWDFLDCNKSFTVSGLEPGQPKPNYTELQKNLFLCYDSPVPSTEHIAPSHLPIRENRGLVHPQTNHRDAILDLKSIEVPTKLLVSCSRDQTVKIWR